jgi:hypothetical protein
MVRVEVLQFVPHCKVIKSISHHGMFVKNNTPIFPQSLKQF